jgi:hypothetical protein
MKCDQIQFDLSAYLDNSAAPNVADAIAAHLKQCPLCRQKLSELQEIRLSLRGLTPPKMPAGVLEATRSSAARENGGYKVEAGMFTFVPAPTKFRLWLASYSVAVCASLFLGSSLMWILASNQFSPDRATSETSRDTSSRVLLAPSGGDTADRQSARDFARSRSQVASESPSVNPGGSLVELTNALMNGELRDDEVVVVADVYENGSARIAEVVEPSRDSNAVKELAKAFDRDTVYSPFVPASFDQRSETVRVILKIQSVDVSTREIPRVRRRSL